MAVAPSGSGCVHGANKIESAGGESHARTQRNRRRGDPLRCRLWVSGARQRTQHEVTRPVRRGTAHRYCVGVGLLDTEPLRGPSWSVHAPR